MQITDCKVKRQIAHSLHQILQNVNFYILLLQNLPRRGITV